MFRQDLGQSEKMVDAILSESGLSNASAQLIKSIFQKQQEILSALEDIIRQEGYINQRFEKRLDELLEKVDPKEAEKRKQSGCEQSAGIRIPGKGLI